MKLNEKLKTIKFEDRCKDCLKKTDFNEVSCQGCTALDIVDVIIELKSKGLQNFCFKKQLELKTNGDIYFKLS